MCADRVGLAVDADGRMVRELLNLPDVAEGVAVGYLEEMHTHHLLPLDSGEFAHLKRIAHAGVNNIGQGVGLSGKKQNECGNDCP